jgi:hypothetical protein
MWSLYLWSFLWAFPLPWYKTTYVMEISDYFSCASTDWIYVGVPFSCGVNSMIYIRSFTIFTWGSKWIWYNVQKFGALWRLAKSWTDLYIDWCLNFGGKISTYGNWNLTRPSRHVSIISSSRTHANSTYTVWQTVAHRVLDEIDVSIFSGTRNSKHRQPQDNVVIIMHDWCDLQGSTPRWSVEHSVFNTCLVRVYRLP